MSCMNMLLDVFLGPCLKSTEVYQVYDREGVISDEPIENKLPGHANNPLLNTDVKNGILGFRYETKNSSIIVYSNVECKTFCYIMQLTPMKN